LFKRPKAPATGDHYPGLLQKKWLYHLLFWLSYYAFAASISLSIYQIHDWHFYIELLSLVPPDMLLVYLNIYLLIPALLLNKKFFSYFLSLLVSLFLYSALSIWLHRLYALSGTEAFAHVMDFNTRNFATHALNAIYLLGLTTGIKFVKDWMLQERQRREKEKQHAETELNFLKSQIHPHFFFNTLNNLYSLTIQKSDLAPEVVLKLSDLMNYMLYESSSPTVPLDKEIANLENYIAIEKLRFGERIVVSFEKEGNTGAVQIPPLILLAFVENSFKHGLKNNIRSIRIDITLSVQQAVRQGVQQIVQQGAQQGYLFFGISNPVEELMKEKSAEHKKGQTVGEEKNGIGLKNVTRRLDLLYGSRYTLDMVRADDIFNVRLKIPVS